MATRIKLKRGSGVPNESQLQEHEVAMDVSTGTIYVGSSSTDAGTDCAVLAEKNQANDTYTDADAISAVEGEGTLDLTGLVKIDRDSSSLSEDDLTLYKDAGSAALEGSGGKANRIPVRLAYTLESDADGEYLVARTEGFKHHSNDKPVYEIDVHSDGDSSTGSFSNYISCTNDFNYFNKDTEIYSPSGKFNVYRYDADNPSTYKHLLQVLPDDIQIKDELTVEGVVSIDRDSSSTSEVDLTLYKDAGANALEGSGKSTRIPVQMAYTLESDTDGEYLVANTAGFKHHSNDKPVFEINVHSDGNDTTGDFENYLTCNNGYVYANQKLQVWQEGSPYRLALSIDPDDTSLLSNNDDTSDGVTLRVEKNTDGGSMDNIPTILELTVNDAYNDTSSEGNRYFAGQIHARNRVSGSNSRAELAFYVDEDDGAGTDFQSYVSLQDGFVYLNKDVEVYSPNGKFAVYNSSYSKILEVEQEEPLKIKSENTYATALFEHKLDTGDNNHTMVKFQTNLDDQTPYTHRMGFTAETMGDNIDLNADEGFCGSLQFEWASDGDHKVIFNTDNYQDSVQSNKVAIEASASVVSINTMLQMKPIETDTTANRPSSPDAGQLFFNTTTKNLQMYTDAWQDITNQMGMMFTSDGGVLYFYDGTNWKPVTLGTAL